MVTWQMGGKLLQKVGNATSSTPQGSEPVWEQNQEIKTIRVLMFLRGCLLIKYWFRTLHQRVSYLKLQRQIFRHRKTRNRFVSFSSERFFALTLLRRKTTDQLQLSGVQRTPTYFFGDYRSLKWQENVLYLSQLAQPESDPSSALFPHLSSFLPNDTSWALLAFLVQLPTTL